jgi:hypothetical protein
VWGKVIGNWVTDEVSTEQSVYLNESLIWLI